MLKLLHPAWGGARLITTAYADAVSGTVHFVLDVAGLVPAAGELADVVNGGIYLLEGNATDATLSFAALMPVGGQMATLGKWSRNVFKFEQSVQGFISRSGLVWKLGSIHGNRVDHAWAHMTNVTVLPNGRPKNYHGIFTQTDADGAIIPALERGHVLSVIDEGWIKVKNGRIPYTIVPGSVNWTYLVDMGRNVGMEGGALGTLAPLQKLTIVVKPNSEEIVTVFPTR